jgi:hypothetical protein
MPYAQKWDPKLQKYIVYKTETGKVVSKHDTQAQAKNHLAKLQVDRSEAE